MSLTSKMESLSSESKGEWFDLKDRISSIRIVTEPVDFRQKFFKSLKKSEICYEGCGYTKGSSTKFLCYIIDLKNDRNPDGSLKVQLFKMNWSVFEAIVNKEKLRKELGEPEYTFPMQEDVVILKEGKDLNTNYAIEISQPNSRYTKEEIALALKGKDSCDVILETWKKTTKERHEKEGAPVEDKKEDSLPVVQLDEEETAFIEKAKEEREMTEEDKAEIEEIKKIPF